MQGVKYDTDNSRTTVLCNIVQPEKNTCRGSLSSLHSCNLLLTIYFYPKKEPKWRQCNLKWFSKARCHSPAVIIYDRKWGNFEHFEEARERTMSTFYDYRCNRMTSASQCGGDSTWTEGDHRWNYSNPLQILKFSPKCSKKQERKLVRPKNE